jgi:hypothetical protein
VLPDFIRDHLTCCEGGARLQQLGVSSGELPPGEDCEVGGCRDRL